MADSSGTFTAEVVSRLIADLDDEIGILAQTYDEFPQSNEDLAFPAMSITTVDGADFTPEMCPYVVSETPVDPEDDANPDTTYKYVVGWYDLRLQVDLWAGNRPERDQLYDLFFKAFHRGLPERLGRTVVLTGYHNEPCHYDMTGYNFEDNEAASQRREWRVKIDLVAHCKAIQTKVLPRILETEAQVEALQSETIDDEEA